MNSRIYYMDAMRSILMMLGVVLHSAQVYNPAHTWLIFNENSTSSAYYLFQFIHAFRMPAFFMVSGYFALLTLRKYGSSVFLKERTKRILIPLAITALFVNSIQTYLLVGSGWMDFNLMQYIKDGGWVLHLWFLVNLVVYFAILALFYRYAKPLLNFITKIIDYLFNKTNIYMLLFLLSFLVLFMMAAFSLLSKHIDSGGNIFNIATLVEYLPYFIFGSLLYHNKNIHDSFVKMSPLFSFGITLIFFVIRHQFQDGDSSIDKIIFYFSQATVRFFISALCFYLFYRFANKHFKIFRFLSDASYTIYLFHSLIVVFFGLLFIKYQIGGILGMLLLMIIVATISISIHILLISKINILSFLFNGKGINRKKSKN